MTAGVTLTSRLIVLMTLINYSFGATVDPTTTIAADTTAGSSADISTVSDPTDSSTSEPAISTVTDSIDSSTSGPEISAVSDPTDSSTAMPEISAVTDSTYSSTSAPEISTAGDSSTDSSAVMLETHSTLSSSEISTVSSTDTSPSAESTPTADSSPSSMTTTSIGTGDNSTEDTVSTASTSSTSLPTTTSTSTSIPPTTTTTQTPPAGTQEPDFGAAAPFEMTFTIGFNMTWNESLSECSGSQTCDFKDRVQTEIDIAFVGCLGYENGSITVLRFYDISKEARVSRQLQVAQFSATGNETYASYNASFDNKIILSQGASVASYIGSVVAKTLVNNNPLVLNGSTDAMATDAQRQVTEFNQTSCKRIGTELCSSICYPCTNSGINQYNVTCQTNCDENHICTADQYNNVSCVCKVDHLPIGDDCVHENIIIGISAGVGGAIVLGLLIAAIVLGCKLNKKDKQYDHLVESNSHHRAEAYDMMRHDGDRKSVSADDVELHAVGHDKTETVASAKTDHDEHESEVVKENHHDHHQPEKTQSKVVDDELKVDYDEAPAANSIEMLNKQSDHYRSLYYSMPDNPGSSSLQDPYAYFVPHLNKIDVNKEYHIKRPQVQHPPANGVHHSHYNHGSFF